MSSVSPAAAVVVVAILAAVVLIVFKILAVRRSLSTPSMQLPVAASTSDDIIDVAAPFKLVRARHGWMLVNPNDAYMGQAVIEYGECCEIEVEFLVRWMSARPGLVLEVGANIGTHTVPMAKALATQGRQLVAFEPQPFIFQNLCANLALNALGNVIAWPNACADRAGTLYFSRPDYSAGGNFGGISMTTAPEPGDIAVPCIALDSIVATETPVALMKIDVEGFELAVLQGAEKTIDRSRPVLYVENDRLEQSEQLIAWLWSKQYRLWWHAPLLFNPDNFFGNDNDLYKRVASFNMLCLPKELGLEPTFGLVEEIVVNRHPLEGQVEPGGG